MSEVRSDTLRHYPPGSQAAGETGCQCPVIGNGYGLGMFRNRETGEPVFVIVADCPLHGAKDNDKAGTDANPYPHKARGHSG